MSMNLTVETEETFVSLLDLAADDDVEGFKRSINRDPSVVDDVGVWYERQKGSKQMILGQRTPLMVAATYGSVKVLRLIVSLSGVDVNRACGEDKSTPLHCAASGGSVNAIDVIKLLLTAGANPNLADANGLRPFDVIIVPPKFQRMKSLIEILLATDAQYNGQSLSVATATSNSASPPLSPSARNGSPSLDLDRYLSPRDAKLNDLPLSTSSEKKEYPIDPTLPDIKNSIYSTDEFRIFSFKIRPCSRAYSHDWTECPFVHPGENARRRDPRKYHYSCVPCPDFRKGSCRRGDLCEYAHGVFECWLHPAQYRTRLCKDGSKCNRRVCFFAHTQEELRPLFLSSGSVVSSPRSGSSTANAMDFAAAMGLLPGSPSVMSPTSFTPPLSPSANGISNMGWHQQNIPALHLPGSNIQSSRLRSSFTARDILHEDFTSLPDFDVEQQQLLNEISSLSQQSLTSNSLGRSPLHKTLAPSKLDDFFSAESLSPRSSDVSIAQAVFSPTHKSAVLNQYQQQQSILCSTNANFSMKNVENHLQPAPFDVQSSGRMSPRGHEPLSPMSSRLSLGAQREKQQQFRSLSSRELGSQNAAAVAGSSSDMWSNWGSSGRLDWAVKSEEFGQLNRSSFQLGNNNEKPDLSWLQSSVKESPPEMKEKSGSVIAGIERSDISSSVEGTTLNPGIEQLDQSALAAWLEQMQLDQLLGQ